MTQARELRELLTRGQVVCLGAYDAMTARLAEKCGASGVYVSGYATAAVRLGQPDLGLVSQTEMADHIERICAATARPVLADADTGYGGPLNVQRTVQLWERAGAAGLHIEDQVFPKRCGHVAGKAVIPVAEMNQKLRAATEARQDPDFLLIARTDAIAVNGIDEAIDRCKCYAETGIDGFFLDAPESAEQLRKISAELGPLGRTLVFNCVRTSKSPIFKAEELADLGFGLIFYPIEAMLTAFKAVAQTYRALLSTGSTDAVADKMATFDDFNKFTGLIDYLALEGEFAA
jgi:2-methylisocitrate lyase-like PEP mutase family enzyme